MAGQSVRRMMGIVAVVAGVLAGAPNTVPRLGAQSSQADLSSADVIKTTLDQQVGKRVRLKLVSGQDLEGQVSKVGTHAVYLIELAGQEFFDATVRLDQIAAVIKRR
jgi:hypothetical protein